jgi:hypothetical protein
MNLMSTFGDLLRSFRQASNDPARLNKRLSQERLGQLIGDVMGDMGFTGAAVSDWERGESKINAADRTVLVAIVQVLHQCGGLKTLADANRLLESGNYRILDTNEELKIFNTQTKKTSKSLIALLLSGLFALPEEEVAELLTKESQGPAPSWPRILAVFMRKASDQFSLSINTILWMGVWLLAKWLIGPSLRLPFESQHDAFIALCLYAGGSLIVPLMIGMLVNTKDNEYWRQQTGINPVLLRLYTYQGSGIGFNVGYFLVFPLSLAGYYLGFGISIWIEILAATVSVILGNMAARVVPHNLWRAYGRLTLKDGWIFFAVALMGPFWAFFLMEYYTTILDRVLGAIIILLALIGVVLFARKNSR